MADSPDRKRARTEEIRQFILENVRRHPRDVVARAVEHFGISRQAVNRHMRALVNEGTIKAEGSGRGRAYHLTPIVEVSFELETNGLQEDRVWAERVGPLLSDLPENVRSICYYGFTEMLNNVIDHSESEKVGVFVGCDAADVVLIVGDNGVGIFQKLMDHCHLDDERQAMLELSKGRLTTDPDHHTGEGIFFTSKMFDYFFIDSGHFQYYVNLNSGEILFEEPKDGPAGTKVTMWISRFCRRTSNEVFQAFASSENDWQFSRTIVPIYLARYEGSDLVSRSQAKRLMARVEQFETVVLDFDRVEMVGQAFADEIFRVWQNAHHNVILICKNANESVLGMINRARKAAGLPLFGKKTDGGPPRV